MLTYFWPIRTGKTFFDAWSLIHFAFWFVVGGNLGAFAAPVLLVWGIFVIGALLWEVLEKYVVHKRFGWVRHPEGWLNSWVSDILMAPLAGWPAYWLIVHVGGL